MNIVAYHSATLVELLSLEAFAPLGAINERQLLAEIRERYSFMRQPDLTLPKAEIESNGLIFESGIYNGHDSIMNISRLAIHKDGIVANASTTDEAEEFFEDLREWLLRSWNFREVPSISLFGSEIIVDFEKPLSNLLKDFKAISSAINQGLSGSQENLGEVSFRHLAFEFKSHSGQAPKFMMERRLDSPVDQERFFCSAPMRTKLHLQTLSNIEGMLS